MKITASTFLEHPPPLPPRLPVRPGSGQGNLDNSQADNSRNLAKSEYSQSSSKNSNRASESSSKLNQFSKSESYTFDHNRLLDCSTPSAGWQGSQASHVTSTPKEVTDVDRTKISEMKAKR